MGTKVQDPPPVVYVWQPETAESGCGWYIMNDIVSFVYGYLLTVTHGPTYVLLVTLFSIRTSLVRYLHPLGW